MELNYKNIHIGHHVKEIARIKNLSMPRACTFLKCNAIEVMRMYELQSMESELLLQWCKLLEYNFFMFYHSHLQLYKPSAATAHIIQDKNESNLHESYTFKKNIYSPEIIEYILGKLDKNEVSVKDIITKYNIPRTTIYRWVKKRKKTSKLEKIEDVNKNETFSSIKKKINYKTLYLDLVEESDYIPMDYKTILREKIEHFDFITFRDVGTLNTLIRSYSKMEDWLDDQQLKAYDLDQILSVLKEQKIYNLTNSEISRKYKMSRNTIARWKVLFN